MEEKKKKKESIAVIIITVFIVVMQNPTDVNNTLFFLCTYQMESIFSHDATQ